MADIKRDDKKLRELILYVAERTADDPNAGAVKLNKILYHAEFQAYRDLGAPISGHPYVALKLGPAPKDLRPIRKNLELAGDAKVVGVQFGPQTQERIVALRSADTSLFSKEELDLVDAVIAELWPLHWTELSADTHRLPGWLAMAPTHSVIPYETAFLSNDVTDGDIARGAELAGAYGWS